MQLKRILAILLAAALIFSIPTVSVGAESTEIFEVGVVAETTSPVSVSPELYDTGESVSVKISADQNTGITMLKFYIYYNVDALEYVSYTSNNLFSNEKINAKTGYVIYSCLLNNASTDNGEILTLNFTTKDTFCGEVEIYTKLASGNMCSNNGSAVSFVGGSDSFAVHDVDATAGVVTDPTCTEEGYTSYHCSICDTDVKGNTVAALGHTEAAAVEENTVDPTCTVEGTYDSVVYCSVCGDELSRTAKTRPATGHTAGTAVEENRVEPTCLDDGSYDSVVYCTVCGEELSRDTIAIPALGHDLINHAAQDPTCTEIGWDAYDTCSRCDYTTYVEIPAHGHLRYEAADENVIKPTCTDKGSYDHVVYCKICGIELERELTEIDALGHDIVHHDAKAPTCTEIGWDAYDTCKRCDYTTYVEKAALGHTAGAAVEENRVEPDCVNKGSYDSVVYCTVCGAELSRDTIEIDALGHTAGAAVEENRVEPDCLNKGSYDSVVYCSVCGDELSRNTIAIDALGHAIVKNAAKAPTCTEIGWDEYDTCSRCDYSTYVEKLPLGHKPITKEENRVEPTCTKAGSYDSVVYCSVCNAELSREKKTVAALGHATVNHDAKAPTCTEIGWDAYQTCAKCDYTTYAEKAALGHKNAAAVEENRVEATCLETGSYDSVVYCSVCNAELSREAKTIAALGHATVNHDAKAPTCTEIGWDAYDTCSRCDYTTYVEKAALGHSYDNNCDVDCNTCGETRTVPAHIYYNACDTTCNECGYVRDVVEHAYNDCFKGYETAITGESIISVDETGVYIITLDSANVEFNVHDIVVFDKEGYAVVYNEKFGGWPLAKGNDYTVKFKYNCEETTPVWNLKKIGSTIFSDTVVGEWYNDAVTYAVGRGIIGGYDNGMFGTADSIQRQDFLVMLARLDGADLSKYADQDSIFPDVAKDCYYEAAVIWGTEKGIVGGYDNGEFGVGDVITREQLVTFLYRYAKYKGIDTDYSDETKELAESYEDFKNVSGFASDAVLWALENGVINGKTATTIVPHGNAQRCEVAQIIYNTFLNGLF